jgi:predicted thioredoxin/glutaredoxin
MSPNPDLENLFEVKAETIIPESLRQMFEAEREGLIVSVRHRMKLKTEKISNYLANPEEEVGWALDSWLQEKMRTFSYNRYLKIMEEQGKKPCSMKYFLFLNGRGDSPYRRLQAIEKKGIKVGSKVVRDKAYGDIDEGENVFTVEAIRTDCELILDHQDGGSSDSYCYKLADR